MGLEVTGGTLSALFVHAAEGLREMVFGDIGEEWPDREERVALDGDDVEELLVSWLNEILYLFETRRLVPLAFRVEEVRLHGVSAAVEGATFDPNRFPVAREVKAITYHRLRLEQEPGGWRACLYVDL